MQLYSKTVFAVLANSLILLGCSKTNPNVEPAPKPVGMANPASEYCVSKGGKLEIKKDEAGNEFGICHLPDGTAMEEWALFRRDHESKQ